MRKIIFLAALLCGLFVNPINTSAQKFENGDNVLSAGIGLGGSLGGLTYSSSPAISLQYEHGTWDVGGPGVISLGAYIGYKSYTNSAVYPYSNYSYSQKWSYTIIGMRSAYHWTGLDSKSWDLYGGVMLAYNILSYTYSDNSPGGNYANIGGTYGSDIGLSLYIGARYHFSDNISAFGELGYGVSSLTLGIAFKL